MSKIYYKNKQYSVKGSRKQFDSGDGWAIIGDKQICWGTIPSVNSGYSGDLHERSSNVTFAKAFGSTPIVVFSRNDDPSGRGEYGAIGNKNTTGFTLFYGGITTTSSTLSNAGTYIAFGDKA